MSDTPPPLAWDDPTDEQRKMYAEFLSERPEHVRAVAARFDPWTMYRLTTTGQRCRVIGFHETEEDGVTVYLYAENPVLGEVTGRNVFGIDPPTVVPWTEADEPEPIAGNFEVTSIDHENGIVTFGKRTS